jgi:hypothetical protein
LGGGGVRLAGLWWVGAVARRCGAGRPTTVTKRIGILRLGSDGVFSCKKREHNSENSNFWDHLSCTVRFPKPTRKNSTMADNHIYISREDM